MQAIDSPFDYKELANSSLYFPPFAETCVILSTKPGPFLRCVRSCINLSGHWVSLAEKNQIAMRKTRVFSTIRGFFGAYKLANISLSPTSKPLDLAVDLWKVINKIKKLISAIAWMCTAGRDEGYLPASLATCASHIKVIHVPFDCISLVLGVYKITKQCFRWCKLQQDKENKEYSLKAERIQSKVVKELFYCSIKFVDITTAIMEQVTKNTSVFIILDSVSALIKISTFFISIINIKNE